MRDFIQVSKSLYYSFKEGSYCACFVLFRLFGSLMVGVIDIRNFKNNDLLYERL